MLRTSLAAALFSGLFAAGCRDCPPPEGPLLRDDGRVYACQRAEECPRNSTTRVCTTTRPVEADCVDCRAGECVLLPSEGCR